MRLKQSVALSVFLTISTPSFADLLVIPINEKALPYELSSSNYSNSPSNYDNSSANYDNSDSNYDNSPSNYDNSPSNNDNGLSGRKRLYTSDNKMIGYYVFSSHGVLNLYNSGGRVGYMPKGGKTQSIFTSKGNEWCGTTGQQNGQTVIGMTSSCLLRFYADR
jgi:hypothetical protein